jgi:hypothetical protein
MMKERKTHFTPLVAFEVISLGCSSISMSTKLLNISAVSCVGCTQYLYCYGNHGNKNAKNMLIIATIAQKMLQNQEVADFSSKKGCTIVECSLFSTCGYVFPTDYGEFSMTLMSS